MALKVIEKDLNFVLTNVYKIHDGTVVKITVSVWGLVELEQAGGGGGREHDR